MPRTDNETRVTPSVLDRLIDLDPRVSAETPKSRSANLVDLKQSVRRDLEWLLNTRCHFDYDNSHGDELKKSVLTFGLPDFTGVSAKSHLEQKRMTRSLENALKIFEPRFIDLKVKMEPISSVDRQLRFRIEARLNIAPTPEPIAFDTVLQLGSGEFAVIEK